MIQAKDILQQGAAVEDIQQRLCIAGYLPEEQIDADFGEKTAAALNAFCKDQGLDSTEGFNDKIWAALVDASFSLGDRSLFLKMPYFHGHDVVELQQALGALGFACGDADGIFGAHTELALRKFQTNMGMFSDGIAGSMTYLTLNNLKHNWEGKGMGSDTQFLGFARVSDVLERHTLCLYGTGKFTRDVARRVSNLALATNPASKIVCAENLLVPPDPKMLLLHIVLPSDKTSKNVPRVVLESGKHFAIRMQSALRFISSGKQPRIIVELPGETWEEAGEERSAQHFAITLIDGLCTALANRETELGWSIDGD